MKPIAQKQHFMALSRVSAIHQHSTKSCYFALIILYLITFARALVFYNNNPQALQRKQCALFSLASPTETITHHHPYHCNHCSQKFASRNALFRHIRADPYCSEQSGERLPAVKLKQMVAIAFGYTAPLLTDEHNNSNSKTVHLAEKAGDIILKLTMDCLHESVELISKTQSTLSRMRHTAIEQDADTAAALDVLVITFLQTNSVHIQELLTKIQQRLSHKETTEGVAVNLVSGKLLEETVPLHAERSCTQYIYHYLLPLVWINNCESIIEWVKQPTSHRPNSKPLVPLKTALRSTESHVCTVTEDERNDRMARGRFGALALRERRPWHNFADPSLRGLASPNQEVVWRVVDRARIHDFTLIQGQPYLIVEFRGDAFLRQQIRRMVGTAVAIANGWLPENYFTQSTKSDVVTTTPVAPAGLLYLVGVRFHFEEMRTLGDGLLETDICGPMGNMMEAEKAISWVQDQLVKQFDKNEVTAWPVNAKSCVMQDLKSAVNVIAPGGRTLTERLTESVPHEYVHVLNLLREIKSNGHWPETSQARSTVIRNLDKQEGVRLAGSFTVVNEKALGEVDGDISLPLGNVRFRALTSAVFELELVLSAQVRRRVTIDGETEPSSNTRQPSTHCAINCNAQFTPHVDSGRGAGQRLSMIVGLGKYSGGEIIIEGDAYDICYRPIEFDGWRLRHWTNRFQGERFSLVWFTPERKGPIRS